MGSVASPNGLGGGPNGLGEFSFQKGLGAGIEHPSCTSDQASPLRPATPARMGSLVKSWDGPVAWPARARPRGGRPGLPGPGRLVPAGRARRVRRARPRPSFSDRATDGPRSGLAGRVRPRHGFSGPEALEDEGAYLKSLRFCMRGVKKWAYLKWRPQT